MFSATLVCAALLFWGTIFPELVKYLQNISKLAKRIYCVLKNQRLHAERGHSKNDVTAKGGGDDDFVTYCYVYLRGRAEGVVL